MSISVIPHNNLEIFFSDLIKKNHLQKPVCGSNGSSIHKARYKMGIQNDIGNCYTKVSKVAHGHDVKRFILK